MVVVVSVSVVAVAVVSQGAAAVAVVVRSTTQLNSTPRSQMAMDRSWRVSRLRFLGSVNKTRFRQT